MTDALIVAPVLVAAVLVVSGVAKLRDPAGVDAAFASMGVPRALSGRLVRRSFPWVEVVLGVLLVVVGGPGAMVVGAGAASLMAAYTVLVARARRRPAATCACFGALTSGKVTGLTLARNITLLALSLLAILDAAGGRSVVVRLATTDAAPWLLGVAAAGWLAFAVLREPPAVTSAEPQPGASTMVDDGDLLDYERRPNPPAVLQDMNGQLISLAGLTAQRAVLAVWVSPGCTPCASVIAKLPVWRDALPQLAVRALVRDLKQVESAASDFPWDLLLVDPFGTLANAVQAQGTPSAVLFGADGQLAGGPVSGPDAIAGFVGDIEAQLRGA